MRSTQILWNGVCIAVLLAWNTNVWGISSYEVDDISIHDSEKMGEPLAENTKAEEEGIMTDNSVENQESKLQYGQRNNLSLQIIKGKLATLGQFPWQVALISLLSFTDYVTENEIWCGGSLIRTNLVLTAAHCLVDDDGKYMTKAYKVIVLLGTLRRNRNRNKVESTDVEIHSNYQKNPRRINDIGYVRLPTRVIESRFIKPIRLPSGSMLKETFAGEMGIVSGYEFVKDDMGYIDNQLTYFDVRIIDNYVCQKALPQIQRSNVCIRRKDGGRLVGGAGDPLIVYKKNEPILIGVSAYRNNRTKDSNTINTNAFTRVSSYIDWINCI